MKQLHRLALVLGLAALPSLVHAETAPAKAPAPSKAAMTEAVQSAFAKPDDKVSVRYASRTNSARATQRGNLGLEPTAANEPKVEVDVAGRRSSSAVSSFYENVMASESKTFATPKTAKTPTVSASAKVEAAPFEPDPLCFLDAKDTPRKRRKR